jgi:hypothetical protein
MKNEQENPAWFSRITVSQQPEEIAVRNNSEAGADSHRSSLLGHNPTTLSVNNNVYHPNLTPDPLQRLENALDDELWRPWGISPPLPVGSGELRKAPGALRTGVRRRAQSPIALGRATSIAQTNPPVWDPSEIVKQRNAAFRTQLKPQIEFGEWLHKRSLSNTAVFGDAHLALVDDPFHDTKRRAAKPNGDAEVDQSDSLSHRVENATEYDDQTESSTYVNPAMWREAYLNSGFETTRGASGHRPLTGQHTLSTTTARSKRDLNKAFLSLEKL